MEQTFRLLPVKKNELNPLGHNDLVSQAVLVKASKSCRTTQKHTIRTHRRLSSSEETQSAPAEVEALKVS